MDKLSLTTQFGATAAAWAWSKYGDEIKKKVFDTLASGATDKLSKGATAAWERVQWKVASNEYRQRIQDRYGRVSVLGKPGTVSLEGIFTDVFILDEPTAYQRYDIEKLRKDPAQVKLTSAQRRNGLELVRRNARLFILGKPGAGKTTFLKYIAIQAAQAKIDKIPIFVGLKEWADSKLDLMPFLSKQFDICGFPDALPFVEHVLAEGHAVVLFDGLDEVKQENEQRDRAIADIRDFSTKYLKCKCLITCRIAATDYTFEQFEYVEIADLSDEQIFSFARKWFRNDDEKYRAFAEGIQRPENSRLYELASVPILLTLLCLSFNATLEFPQRRVEVYEEALDALLKTWDSSRNIKRDEIYRGLTQNRKRQLLAYVAAITFQQDKFFVPQTEMATLIVRFLRQLPGTDPEIGVDEGEEVLQSIEAQHGILSKRAQKIYSFSHLTFQEYFAAKSVVDDPSGQRLKALLSAETVTSDRWREVILMVASLLNNAEAFFEQFRSAIFGLIQDHSNLTALFDWADRSAKKSVMTENVVSRRLQYLSLGLIFDNDRAKSRERARALQLALTRAEQFSGMWKSKVDLFRDPLTAFPLGLNQMRADNKALEPDRAYDIQLEFEVRSNLPETLGLTTDLELTRLAFIADLLAREVSEGPRRVLGIKFADYFKRLQNQLRFPVGDELDNPLSVIASPDQPLVQSHIWVKLADQLRAILRNEYDVGYDWRLTKHDVELITQVLQASNLMHDSLQVASLDGRESIADSLLSLKSIH